jgi:ferredoxin/flavodoxin---NADP+ reductase
MELTEQRLSTEKHYIARILERKELSEDLWIIKVNPGGPFTFKAGQYATLGVNHEGKRIERAYSIVSSPYETDFLEFFLELVPHGELTPRLYKLHTGDTMLCRKIAKGRFTLDLRSGRTNHLLLATVTGIAPFVSYVRTLYRDWKSGDSPMPGNHKLYCIQGGSRSWEFGYLEEMERVAAEVPWLKFVAAISRPWEDANWKGETGRVDDLIRKYVSDWGLKPAETTGYLCGHPNMIDNGRGILQRAGWQKGFTFEEVYFLPTKEVEST